MGKAYETGEQARARLSEALRSLPDQWVMCRDVRHAWSVEDDFHVTVGRGSSVQEIRRRLVCMRCGTKRIEVYAPSHNWGLEKTHMHYEYPDTYQIRGVPRGNKPQALIQAEQYRRTMMKVAELQRNIASV